MSQKKFWMWRNQADAGGEKGEADSGGARELELYGTIAEESWFDDDITPAMFREELFAGSGPITVWINSPGGDCIAASQIYTMLMDYKDDVTVKIDGIAASAASVIAMAGTEVLMAPTALMMIHNPATIAMGDHDDIKKAIAMLDEVKESIINAYEIKTSLSRDKLSKLMDAETWMNANKAVELGFADGVMEDEKNLDVVPAYAFSRKTVQAALMNKIATISRKEKARQKRSQEDVLIDNPLTIANNATVDQVEKNCNSAEASAPNPGEALKSATTALAEEQVSLNENCAKKQGTDELTEVQIRMIRERAEKLVMDAAFPGMREMSDALRSERDPEREADSGEIQRAKEETVEPAGRSVDELKARLATIKDFI